MYEEELIARDQYTQDQVVLSEIEMSEIHLKQIRVRLASALNGWPAAQEHLRHRSVIEESPLINRNRYMTMSKN